VLLGVLVYYNWQLTLVTLVVAPLIALALRAFSARLRRLSLANQAMLGELTRAVQEGHEASRVIKVYGGQQQEHEHFERINGKLRRFALKMQVAWSAATPVTQVIASIGLAFVFGVALWQARAQQLSAGNFVTFLTAALMLLGPLRHLAGLNTLQDQALLRVPRHHRRSRLAAFQHRRACTQVESGFLPPQPVANRAAQIHDRDDVVFGGLFGRQGSHLLPCVGNHLLPLLTQALDAQGHHVARFEPSLSGLHAKCNARGRARGDDAALMQSLL